jgi:purine-binding chemotaxis protein CheW
MTTIDNTLDILNLQFTGNEHESQLLVFNVDGEEFGVDVLLVQEIIRYIKSTKVPKAPEAVQGVINFRGEVIPVLDIRKRFGLPARDYDEFTVIVVVEYGGRTMGMVVDHVSDIVSLATKDIQLVPEFAKAEQTDYLRGMGKLGDRLIMLLNMEKIINLQDKALLEAMMDSLESPDEAVS